MTVRQTHTVVAKPGPYTFSPRSTALIVVDMQRDAVEVGGWSDTCGLDVKRVAAVVPVARKLIDVCRAADVGIIHTREAYRADLADCPPSHRKRGEIRHRIGDPGPLGRILVAAAGGTDIVPVLAPRGSEILIDKPGKCAFHSTALGEILRFRGVTHLLFAGALTDNAVQCTMRAASDRGYECLLIEDASDSYVAEFKRATLEMIVAAGGQIGWTALCDDVANALAG